jgi:S1-C subfamily serine protease
MITKAFLKRVDIQCGSRRAAIVTLSAIAFFLAIPSGMFAAPADTPAQLPSPPASEIAASPAQSAVPPSRQESPGPHVTPSSAIENSVVKVFSTLARPDLYRPWSKQPSTEISGSGAIVSGNHILTNAHVVLYASQIEIQANQAGDKIPATVEAVAPGIDLALLKIEDPKFFDSHPAIPLRKTLPDVKEPVLVYGYPTGGTSLSITKGIISRIEFTGYTLAVPGLRIQIDAAINPGNSGGPAVVGDEMIGIAFSHLTTAQNIGYIIPCEEIELFLKDVATGHYQGKPAMYDDLQTLENPALRKFLKLDPNARGEVVHKPFSTDPNYPLKEWDVITRIGDVPVDDQGMIQVSDNLRLRFQYLIQKIAKGNKVPLTVIRAGKETKIELPVLNDRPLVLPDLDGSYPSYFIYGPMVFSDATTDFIGAFARNNAKQAPPPFLGALSVMGSPLILRIGDKPAFAGERLVVVSSPFFPNKLVSGYGNPAWQVIKTINGHAIQNLSQLVGLLSELKDEFVTIEFSNRSGGETLVFPRAEMAAATETILNDNSIRSQGSPDMMKIWNTKPAH